MKFVELCKLDDRLLAIYEEAGAFRCLNEAGEPIRTFSAERAAKLRKDPNYCKQQLWRGLPGKRGEFGLLDQMKQCVGWGVAVPELASSEAYDICYHTILDHITPCQHDGECYLYDYPAPKDIQPCGNCGSSVLGSDVKDTPQMTSWTCQCGARRESLKRHKQVGFGSIIDRLKHKVAEMEAEEKGTPPPAPLELIDENTHVPDDKTEPAYIVRSEEDAHTLALMLRIKERFDKGELTRWYCRNAIYVCDKKARKELLSLKLNKSSITGALRWKPVVLTFKDEELERKLGSVCTQVVTVPGKREPGDAHNTITLEDVRAAVKEITTGETQGTPDMLPEVLDGWLGEVCRTHMADLPLAYAWVALLTAASVKLPNLGKIRANLFSGAIGPMGSGKTSAYELAFWLMEVKEPKLLKLKSGSSEGMAERIGDVQAETRLVFVNELAHLLAKVNYEGSTFEQFLNDAFYDDFQELTVARRKQVTFNCRLTLCGGIPEDRFQDLFGVGTAGGFHNRACFAMCPTVFKPYPWRPLVDESPLRKELAGPAEDDPDFLTATTRPQTITVDVGVWKEKSRWESELGLDARSAELGIRAAIIAACFDNRGTLKVSDLGPALAFAKYQDDAHKRFEPNPGKTNEGIITHKTLTHLTQHAPDGEKWLNRRDLFNAIHAYEFGASVATRALQSLEAAGEIEQTKNGRQWLVRLNPNHTEKK